MNEEKERNAIHIVVRSVASIRDKRCAIIELYKCVTKHFGQIMTIRTK